MERTDCFAYIKTGESSRCYALTQMDCKGCSFYKHSDDPDATRRKIENKCKKYAGTHTDD